MSQTCPSRYQLAAFDAGDARTPALASHVGSCARCGGVLAELAESRRDLLGEDPTFASTQAARRILAAADERRAARRSRWLPRWVGLAVLPAAAALVLVLSTRQMVTPPDSSNRTKGALVMEVFCKRGDSVFAVNEGADFFPGDRLRFAYTKDQPGFLTVFSVDDTGQISPYYRDAVLGSVQVGAGAKVMLPESVELDSHRGWERIFALWSPRPVDDDAIRRAVSGALASADGDVRRAGRLDIEAEQVSYLLRRP